MSIITKIKGRLNRPKNPIKAASLVPVVNMPKRLRQNATGLQAHYGSTQFIDRIKAAADALEELETALQAIALSTKEPRTKALANDALDAYDRMRK